MSVLLTNEKLQNFPTQVDYHAMEAILESMDATNRNKLNDQCWFFLNGLSVNFAIINALKTMHPKWCKAVDIDVTWLAKIIFLTSIQGCRGSTTIRYTFDSIVKTFYFLAERNKQFIRLSDLEDFFNFVLMHSIHNNQLSVRLAPLSYHNFSVGVDCREWLKIIKTLNLPLIGFDTPFSNSTTTNALKNTIEIICAEDLTFRDWKEGGSFNHLTLDYGKYYVEHCMAIFDQHISLATALRKTLNQASTIAKEAGIFVNKKNLRSYVMVLIGNFLVGRNVDQLPKASIKKSSRNWLVSLENSTLKILRKNLQIAYALDTLTHESTLIKFADKIKLKNPSKNQLEWIKWTVQMRWTELSNPKNLSILNLRISEVRCLAPMFGSEFELENLSKLVDEAFSEILKEKEVLLPNIAFFQEAGIKEKSTQSSYLFNFIRLVEIAGMVKFVAITGWRESEFGFTLKDIHPFQNLDLLDQLACPVRFEIEWFVPKTNGETKLKRELTRTAYDTALKLAELVNADDSSPCLYSFTSSAKKPTLSGEFIKTNIAKPWQHFVENYGPFKQVALIDELNALKLKQNRTELEDVELKLLSGRYANEHWQEIESDLLLRAAFDRAKNEFERVVFSLSYDSRRKAIWEYRQGTLNAEYSRLFDTYLSEESKNAIHAIKSENHIIPSFTKFVMNELLSDCLYPTPHPFRHMWAESVYRRFDGDVGWMIRSNFKHISLNMWLAYIRNKDNRRQHDRVKRKIVSSLLSNYVLKKGVGYAGAMDKFLRRIFLHTQTATLDELNDFVEHYSRTEILDIKASPWGYCILRKRGQSVAKCAEQGVPQRQNASPEFCLGCTNNLTQAGNVEGILLGIANDLNVLRNKNVPASFQRSSFTTVQNAYKQLRKLNVDRELLSEIESALNGTN
jgi:hypothetical protein